MLNCKADPTLKDYFRDKVHFADFLNGIYFSGRQVLSPEHLSVVDTDMSTVVEGKKGTVSFNRNRDVIMKDNQNGIYVLNAIENQKAIDYTMPVRVFVYDALMYNQQLKQLKKKKGKKKVKLEPVMTSVIYYGERSWSGPRCLSDMMKIPKEYKGMINDWDARIIDIKDIDVDLFQDEDNRSLIQGIQMFYRWNGKEEIKLEVKKEVAILIASIVNSKKFLKIIKEQEGEKVVMCTSLDLFAKRNRKAGFNEGKSVGKKEGRNEGKKTMLIELLKTKIGYLSKETIQLIRNCNRKELEQLTKQFVMINNQADILKILKNCLN